MPDLVRDLARFHVAFRVVLGRLQLREAAQRPAGELREARDALHRHDQRVATEQRHEPRHAGSRDEDAALERGVLQLERLQVAHGLVPRSVHDRVGRLDADVGRGAWRRPCAATRPPRCSRASTRRRLERGDGQPFQAGVPDILGRDRRDEHQAPVGELGRRRRALDRDDQVAPEVAVDVARAQLAARAEPARVELPAAHDLAALHVEDVREVGKDRDLDRSAGPVAASS